MNEEIQNPQNSTNSEIQPTNSIGTANTAEPSELQPATSPGNGKHHVGQSYKFKAEHLKQLIAGLAKFYTHNEIITEFNKTNDGLTISQGGLDLIVKNYKQEISLVRQQWLARIADEPAVHKRVRVRELWKWYNRLETAIADNPKDIKGLTYQAGNIMQQIRIEVEGQRVNLTVTPLHTLDDPDLIDKAHEIYSKHRIEAAEFTDISSEITKEAKNANP